MLAGITHKETCAANLSVLSCSHGDPRCAVASFQSTLLFNGAFRILQPATAHTQRYHRTKQAKRRGYFFSLGQILRSDA